MRNTKVIKPTESELEILTVLWANGEATVRTVHEELTKTKDAGYTTTLKLMQIMHEKGLLERETGSRTHVYKALASQSKTSQSMLDSLIANVFNGSAAQLVMQALSNKKSSQEEIEMIKKYLNELDKK